MTVNLDDLKFLKTFIKLQKVVGNLLDKLRKLNILNGTFI